MALVCGQVKPLDVALFARGVYAHALVALFVCSPDQD